MKRLAIIAMVGTLALAAPRRASASILGEESALLAELIGLQLEELTEISTLITNVKLVIGGLNEIASLARAAKRIYDAIRKYSLNDLLQDAKTGLYRAFPDLEKIEQELAMLKANGQAIEKGKDAFFGHVDYHDAEMNRVATATFRHAFRSTIWPAVFPEAMSFDEYPSPVDELIQRRYKRAGLNMRMAIQNTALGMLSEKIKTMVEDAEAKERTDLQTAALNAQANVQTTNNTTMMRDLAEIEHAEREAAQIRDEHFQKEATKSMRESTDQLFEMGAIQ